jgi:hypothetical protein
MCTNTNTNTNANRHLIESHTIIIANGWAKRALEGSPIPSGVQLQVQRPELVLRTEKRNSEQSWYLGGPWSRDTCPMSAWSTGTAAACQLKPAPLVHVPQRNLVVDLAGRTLAEYCQDGVRASRVHGTERLACTSHPPLAWLWPRSVDRHQKAPHNLGAKAMSLASHRGRPKMLANCACDALHAAGDSSLSLGTGTGTRAAAHWPPLVPGSEGPAGLRRSIYNSNSCSACTGEIHGMLNNRQHPRIRLLRLEIYPLLSSLFSLCFCSR